MIKFILILFLGVLSLNSYSQSFITTIGSKSRGTLVVSESTPPVTPPPTPTDDSTYWDHADIYVGNTASGDTIAISSLASTIQSGDSVAFIEDINLTSSITIPVSNVTFGSYGTGKKSLYASIPVSSWDLYSGHIYRASLDVSSVSQVFVDDIKQNSARYPNSGYFDITTVNSSNSFTSTQISGSIDYTGAVAIERTREWYIATNNVTGSSGQQLTISSAPLYDLNVGEGFVLFNKLDFLDQATEWYYDASNNYLYLWVADGDDPDNYTVRASVTDDIITADSKSNIKIQDLQLIGASSDAVYLNNCDYVTIDNCVIKYAESMGVSITNGGSDHNTISNCTISDISSYGIETDGTYLTINNNEISNIGMFNEIGVVGYKGQAGTGIHIENGSNNTIEYNTITNVGYNGIHFFNCPNTLVQYNLVKGACLTIQDGAGIYCFESTIGEDSDNSLIQYNVVDSVPGNLDGHTSTLLQGDGIYLDDRMSYTTVLHNTIKDCSHYGLYFHNNKYCSAKYNTIYRASGGYRATPSYSAIGDTIMYNIFVNTGDSFSSSLALLHPSDVGIVTIDHNSYVDHHRTTPFKRMDTYADISFSDWKTVMGEDANSTFDGSTLGAGEVEVMFYNATNTSAAQDLSGHTYKDATNTISVTDTTLLPFTIAILIQQ